MLPAATLTSVTATGDLVVGPGDPTYIVTCLPIACMGDAVAGPVCVGAISSTTSMVIAMGLPVATITGMVTGVNPELGFPVETALAVTVGMNEIR